MISVYVEVDPKLRQLELVSKEAVYSGLMRVANEVRKQVSKEPPPVFYPVQWKSQRQKRFVMFKLRLYGLPYTRKTHPLSENLYDSWKIAGYPTREEVIVYTDVSYAPYVKTKMAQQPFHRNTGHTTVETDIKKVDAGRIVNTELVMRLP